MDTSQNFTNVKTLTDKKVAPVPGLTEAQNHYVTYVAANGLSVDFDGKITKITGEDFAASIGVTRRNLYYWQEHIPGFWDLVKKRRKEIFTKSRENVIWNGLFLRAAKGDSKQAEMILSHFGDYVPPTQKHEVKISGLTDLASLARNKHERKAIDANPNNP